MLKEYWDKLLAKWNKADTRGKAGAIALAALVVFIILSAIFGGKAEAAELGPHPDVTFFYGAPAVSFVGNRTEATGIVGVRHSWHPVDFVAEGVLRERSGINFLASKGFGDIRVLGGISLNSGADNAGLVLGAEYKRFIVRINTYGTNHTNPSEPVLASSSEGHRRCPSPPPTSKTTNSGHTAFTIGYSFPLGAR